jgi:U2 small nuclear ribonucleoprotein A'
MVRITAELISQAPQFLNPLHDREIDLRGNKIPTIENMGATLDQFDTIDLSDNDITRLDGFPLLKRLKTFIINNNRIHKIAWNLAQSLPRVEELILTNNNVCDFSDIDAIANLRTLTRLSLMRNPVSMKLRYREYVIHKLPNLKLLDFRKVKLKERQAAERLFSGEEGARLRERLAGKPKILPPGESLEPPSTRSAAGLTPDQIARIKEAIQNASSLQEARRLEAQLQSGIIPNGQAAKDGQNTAQTGEEDEGEAANTADMSVPPDAMQTGNAQEMDTDH